VRHAWTCHEVPPQGFCKVDHYPRLPDLCYSLSSEGVDTDDPFGIHAGFSKLRERTMTEAASRQP